MQIRIFTVDENGFIKIRPEDFESLLNDVYTEGYSKNSLTIGFQEPKALSKDVIYPTWGDWLIEQGIIETSTKGFCIGPRVNEHISADIAKKLGLESKEGNKNG